MEKQIVAGSTQGWGRGVLNDDDRRLSGLSSTSQQAADESAERADQRIWRVDGDFNNGGPWAGVKDVLRGPVADAMASQPDLINKHSYELAYVFPELRERMNIRNLTLTELASRGEKVRNYPADRAYRVVNGLIDFLCSCKGDASERWLIELRGADQLGSIGRRFFQELLRRRGDALALNLIFSLPSGHEEAALKGFSAQARARIEVRSMTGEERAIPDPEISRSRALELEAEVGDDPLAIEVHLPEMICCWTDAGCEERMLHWLLWGLDIYNNLGLYHDARRYGEPALDLNNALGMPLGKNWALFTKLLMSGVGTQDGEQALELTQGWSIETIDSPLRCAQYCYLMAMLLYPSALAAA